MSIFGHTGDYHNIILAIVNHMETALNIPFLPDGVFPELKNASVTRLGIVETLTSFSSTSVASSCVFLISDTFCWVRGGSSAILFLFLGSVRLICF